MGIPGGCEHTAEGVPHDNGWMSMQHVYFEYLLMGEGKPFPRVVDDHAQARPDNSIQVDFRVRGAVGTTSATVYYSPSGTAWRTRKWSSITAEPRRNFYEARIPADSDWFALATDARPVTVSSGVHFRAD